MNNRYYLKLGDLFSGSLSNLPPALASYQSSLAIAEDLVRIDPSNVRWQRDLSIAYEGIGDVQVAQGNLTAALTSYRASLAIRERLAQTDAGNAGWQRDLIVSYVKLNEVSGDKAYGARALEVALAMRKRGTLVPRDTWLIEKLKRRAGR